MVPNISGSGVIRFLDQLRTHENANRNAGKVRTQPGERIAIKYAPAWVQYPTKILVPDSMGQRREVWVPLSTAMFKNGWSALLKLASEQSVNESQERTPDNPRGWCTPLDSY